MDNVQNCDTSIDREFIVGQNRPNLINEHFNATNITESISCNCGYLIYEQLNYWAVNRLDLYFSVDLQGRY
jgi:hypothetical protein